MRISLRQMATAAQHRRVNARPLRSPEVDDVVLRARDDPDAFIEYAFADERGRGFRQAKHHREWQALFTAHPALALLGFAEGGKTLQVGLRLVWELGRNPEVRLAIIGASQGGAKKVLGIIKRAIESNERVRRVFPHLRPGPKWTESELLVQRRQLETKDWSVQAYGAASEILGLRADIVVVDDINNLENSRTSEARKKIVDWFDAIVQSRLVAGGRVWVIGNAWHREDLIHMLATRGGWELRRYSLLDDQWQSNWPEQFPLARIATIRGRITGLAFARMYLVQPLDDETSRFEESWFEVAKEKGKGVEFHPLKPPMLPGGDPWFVATGVDLASGKRARQRKGDTSVLFTIAFHPRQRIFRLLDLQVGNWKSPEILARMRGLAERYDPVFGVEDNGTQQLFVDAAQMPSHGGDESRYHLRVMGLTTTSNKWDEGVGIDSLALDLEQHRWIIPSDPITGKPHDVVADWIQAMIFHSPKEHTADTIMACWICVRTILRCHKSVFAIQRRMLR